MIEPDAVRAVKFLACLKMASQETGLVLRVEGARAILVDGESGATVMDDIHYCAHVTTPSGLKERMPWYPIPIQGDYEGRMV